MSHIKIENFDMPETSIKQEPEPWYDSINIDDSMFECKDELIWSEEVDEAGVYEEVEDEILSDEDYEPDEDELKEDMDFVPLEYKIRAVNLAKAHPKWNLKSLHTKGVSRLKRICDLKLWEEQIKQGGTRKDKCNTIDTLIYDRFVKARRRNQPVDTKNLRQWAVEAASKFPNFEFKASEAWAKGFKRRHKIRQRKLSESEGETPTLEETVGAPENSSTV